MLRRALSSRASPAMCPVYPVQALNFEKNSAPLFMGNIYKYVFAQSVEDLHLGPDMVFNAHVHNGKFFKEVSQCKNSLPFKLLGKLGDSYLLPSSKTVKELVEQDNIACEVRAPLLAQHGV